MSPDLGRNWTGIEQNWAEVDRLRADIDRRLADIGPTSTDVGPRSTKCWASVPDAVISLEFLLSNTFGDRNRRIKQSRSRRSSPGSENDSMLLNRRFKVIVVPPPEVAQVRPARGQCRPRSAQLQSKPV